MPVIGTSGSTSGDGKRRVAAWPKRPRPSSTLPNLPFVAVQNYVRFSNRPFGVKHFQTIHLCDPLA
jgi:hypothetical protein